MRITSDVPGIAATDVRRMLSGLPDARGYRVVAKPLRYRSRPHLAAWTDFEARQITLQVPEPFVPFGEVVPVRGEAPAGEGTALHLALRGRDVPDAP